MASLNDLVGGVQFAVEEAQDAAEAYHAELVGRFFHTVDGELRAITQKIHVPNMNPATMAKTPFVPIDVPLICLMKLGGIKIKELKVIFVTNLSSLDTEEDEEEKKGEAAKEEADADANTPPPLKGVGRRARKWRRLAMGMKKSSGSGEDTKATIEITFVGTDPPEGVVRVNDRLLKTIP